MTQRCPVYTRINDATLWLSDRLLVYAVSVFILASMSMLSKDAYVIVCTLLIPKANPALTCWTESELA